MYYWVMSDFENITRTGRIQARRLEIGDRIVIGDEILNVTGCYSLDTLTNLNVRSEDSGYGSHWIEVPNDKLYRLLP